MNNSWQSRKGWRIAGTICLLAIVTGLSFWLWPSSTGEDNTSPPQRKGVYVYQPKPGEYQLVRDGQPLTIQGACGDRHLQQLAAAGGNTIRCYDLEVLPRVLREAKEHNLQVIAGLPLPKSNHLDFYRDRSRTDSAYQRIQRIVARFHDHPALLIWNVGNELHFPYRTTYEPFYQFYNRLLAMIDSVDGKHPISTTLVNFDKGSITNLQLKVPAIDIIAFNTFGHINGFSEKLENFAWMWEGPFLIMEWGFNGYWESDRTIWDAPLENPSWKKAEQLVARYEQEVPHQSPRCLGTLMFFWGSKHERTASWFGFFTEDSLETELVDAARKIWGQPSTGAFPPINYLTLFDKGGNSHPVFTPGAVLEARLHLRKQPQASYSTQWRLQQEDWFSLELDTVYQPISLPINLIDQSPTTLTFRAPMRPGPYRLYLQSSTQPGYATTANIPFFILAAES